MSQERRFPQTVSPDAASPPLEAVEAAAERDRDAVRRQFLDARSLDRVGTAIPGFREPLRSLHHALYNELRRNFERIDRRAGIRSHRDALCRRFAEQCASGDPEAEQALREALGDHPGDAELLALADAWGGRELAVPAVLRRFGRVAAFADPAHALLSATCSLRDGFWTGNRQGVVRRFDASGRLLRELHPETQHVEKLFTDQAGNLWVCDPLARTVAVLAPDGRILGRLDFSGRLTSCRSGITGCGGAFGVFVAVYDEASDRSTVFQIGTDRAATPVHACADHLSLAQTRDGVFAVLGHAGLVRRLVPDPADLFRLPPGVMSRPVRVAGFSTGGLFFYGKDTMAVYALTGERLARSTFLRHSEGCSLLGAVEQGGDPVGLFHLANPNESVIRVMEA